MTDSLNFTSILNTQQLDAVRNIEGPMVIIAGAGSGKTSVISCRIAGMLESGIPQYAILALTFTNKAAREMESRIKELTGKKLRDLTACTFHAFGVKILRKEIEVLGYRSNFSIYDETDKAELIKECLREGRVYRGSSQGEDINIYSLGQLFSNIKTGRYSWNNAPDLTAATGEIHKAARFERVYREYQSSLKVYNALDFDDLLVLPIAIFENHCEILEKYRSRFCYIMVDEFQDTSLIQYRLLRLLASTPSANVCIVGDDDQSIYSWRGANYENLLKFERDFPNAREIKLEQNYRSTTTILEAANGVISNNTNRKEKNLWTGNATGRLIELYYPEDEKSEADYIAGKIREHALTEGLGYDAFGVLVRTNFLMRSLEEAFMESNIPYRVSGGMSFYQRKEIKDMLSYLRFIANTNDDVNLLRIINTPRRGIGKGTIQIISDLAKRNKTFLWDAMERLCRAHISYPAESFLSTKIHAELTDFIKLIEDFREAILGKTKGSLSLQLKLLVEQIGYWEYLNAEFKKNEKIAAWRYANIEYLIQSIEQWEKDPDNYDTGLYAWLNRISLINSNDTEDDQKEKVNLSTIHAAKGLEFPVVFIAGAEEGIIPHTRSLEDAETNEYSNIGSPLEEERRLFYVAITRAQTKLYITSCYKRRRLQEIIDCTPSPFLEEISPDLVDVIDSNYISDNPAETEAFFSKMKEMFK